jgi:hypothetical protein
MSSRMAGKESLINDGHIYLASSNPVLRPVAPLWGDDVGDQVSFDTLVGLF